MTRLRQWLQRLLLSGLGRFWRPVPQSITIRRVMILEMTRLGDVVCASALMDPLKAAYPDARLEFVAQAQYAPLFEGDARVSFVGLPAGFGFFKEAWNLRGRLRGADLAIFSVSPSAKNSVLCWLSKPGLACGFLFPQAKGLGYDESQPLLFLENGKSRRLQSSGKEHLVERAALSLALAGIGSLGLSPRLVSQTARVSNRVVLHAGANWAWRRWPFENFVALQRELEARGKEVILVGPQEQQPLAGLRDLLASAELFIGNDSGPLHLAASLGTPCIGLFGPNLPERSGPWPRAKHKVLRFPVPCSPCDQTICVQPQDWCMAKLSVERVLREI